MNYMAAVAVRQAKNIFGNDTTFRWGKYDLQKAIQSKVG